MFEQELVFAAFMDVVQEGGEYQVWSRREQAEQYLIGEWGAPHMAGPEAQMHCRCVGGQQSQPALSRHDSILSARVITQVFR